MRIGLLILLPCWLFAQAPSDSEWESYPAHRYGRVKQLNLVQQEEGSPYPEWNTRVLYDSLIVLRNDGESIFGIRPAGGYGMRWDRQIFNCPDQKLKKKAKKAQPEPHSAFVFDELYQDQCELVVLVSDSHSDTLWYTSTWNCYDPMCGNKHGHIQFRTEHWKHPQFGVLVTRTSNYGRPSHLSYSYTNDPGWMRLLESLSKNVDWEFTSVQARKMKKYLGFKPEL